MLLNLVPKWNFTHFLYYQVTSYGYIKVDSCIISFNLNWIMRLKQFYDIATKVSSRKSATTIGDLPDCSVSKDFNLIIGECSTQTPVLHPPIMSGDILTYVGDLFNPSIDIECLRPAEGWGDAGYVQVTWWRDQMDISALLALCAGNSPVTSEFPLQRPVTLIFDVFFDLGLNKRWNKQSRGWWFETPSRSLWRHCDGYPTRWYLKTSKSFRQNWPFVR